MKAESTNNNQINLSWESPKLLKRTVFDLNSKFAPVLCHSRNVDSATSRMMFWGQVLFYAGRFSIPTSSARPAPANHRWAESSQNTKVYGLHLLRPALQL